MLECRDPAIKLFGMKISFPAVTEEKRGGGGEEENSTEKGTSTDKPTETAEQETQESPENKNNVNENPQNSSQDSKSKSGDEDESSKDQSESINSQENHHQQQQQEEEETEKPLKKPSKILPCPRCNSMDTKFCYYNNYNINQPRHFCKACQRYWTAGGTMRNVPVGAGRRKNKTSSPHYRHFTISEALQAARLDAAAATTTTTYPNGRVLSFALEAQHPPICDSMASVLKLGAQKGARRNGLVARVDNVDDCSTATHNHSTEDSRTRQCRVPETHMMMAENNNNHNMKGFACIPNVPWPYTWSTAVPPPGFYPPPGYPMPFYPYWSIPVLSPQSSSSSSQKGSSSLGPNSPTLGKHSRDEEEAEEKDVAVAEEEAKQGRKGRVLVPKTLRIDDPSEAAKSSIWTTLGIKNEAVSRGGNMFKGFDDQMEKQRKKNRETSPVLRANPAALSRSIEFHERV